MREIVVISGKGGTGKTSVTAAFAHLASRDRGLVVCDLDVDAPDLHILLAPDIQETEDFISGEEARIDQDRCVGCGECLRRCAFEAVRESAGRFEIDPLRCEGCMVCQAVCPAGAVLSSPRHCGVRHVSRTRFGTMAHARLFPGQENSGRLVALLRRQARDLALAQGLDRILCDGSPGIGCPVISSLTGADLAVIITEPTPSGRHDLERAAALCARFRLPVGVCINKFDLNPRAAEAMAQWRREQGDVILAMLPFDLAVVDAMQHGQAVTEWPGSRESVLSRCLAEAWRGVESMLETLDTAPRGGQHLEKLS